jgi:hypothetical protein
LAWRVRDSGGMVLPRVSGTAIPQVQKKSAVNAGAGKDFGQIRIPGQILFACPRLGFAYLLHYYG